MASTGSKHAGGAGSGPSLCLKCGAHLPARAAYCFRCGQSCAAVRPSDIRPAPADEARAAQVFCHACHRENFKEARYCMFCGAVIVAAASTTDHRRRKSVRLPVERRAILIVAGVAALGVTIWGGWYALNSWRASKGWQLMEAKAPESAVPYLLRAADAFPNNEVIRFRLGLAYLRAGQAGEAIQHLKRAWNDRPDMAEAGWILGDAYLDAGMPSLAIPMYQRMLPTAPHARETWHRLAQAYKAAGEPDRAREAYQQMERLKPEAP